MKRCNAGDELLEVSRLRKLRPFKQAEILFKLKHRVILLAEQPLNRVDQRSISLVHLAYTGNFDLIDLVSITTSLFRSSKDFFRFK